MTHDDDTATITTGTITLTVTLDGYTLDRPQYTCTIDYPGGQYVTNDLHGGTHTEGDPREGMESLVSFLQAAAESRDFEDRTGLTGENADLFPSHVMDHLDTDNLADLYFLANDALEGAL